MIELGQLIAAGVTPRPLWHLLQCRFDPAHPPHERCTDAAAYGDTLPMEG